MATVSLNASPRSQVGKGAARKIRSTGKVPAVVYRDGRTPKHLIIDPAELELAFHRTGNPNTLVDLDAGDHRAHCIVREVQRHPVSLLIEHVDFYELADDSVVEIRVPIRPIGKAVGTEMGGKLQLLRRDVKLRCKPANIPEAVEVDVTPLDVGGYIKIMSVPPPTGCEFLSRVNFNVVTVIGKRGPAEAEAEAAV